MVETQKGAAFLCVKIDYLLLQLHYKITQLKNDTSASWKNSRVHYKKMYGLQPLDVTNAVIGQ